MPCVLVFGVVTLGTVFLAAPAGAANYPWPALFDGQILVENEENSDGIPGVRAVFTISADRDDAWKALVDYPNYKNIFSNLDEFHVLSEDASGAVLEYRTDAIFTTFHYILRREYVVPGFHMTWHNIGGDFKTIEGSWQLTDTPDPTKTLLVFEAYLDTGSAFLDWLIKPGVEGRTRQMAQRLRDWIEDHN